MSWKKIYVFKTIIFQAIGRIFCSLIVYKEKLQKGQVRKGAKDAACQDADAKPI